MRYRHQPLLVGTPQVSGTQSRNGMNNGAVQKKIRNYLYRHLLPQRGPALEEYPADHALGMFYRLITRGEFDEFGQLFSR
jgi:hypothetical protein